MMKSKRFLVLAIVALLLLSTMVGCSDDGESVDTPPSDGQTQGNGEADLDDQQYFTFTLAAEPSTLDPSKGADNYSNTILENVLEPLLRLEENDDQTTYIEAAGAESWDSNEDGTVWTFHLRENTWSDGEKVTAYDYEYGIKRSLDPETASPYAWIVSPILNANSVNSGEAPVDDLGVKALDEDTLEITLGSPTPFFEQLTYIRVMYPQREDIVEEYGDRYGSELDTIVYNGPFTLTNWVHNSELTLTKNESYWDKDRVILDNVNLKIIEDENAIYNSFTNGSIDAVETNSPEWKGRFMEEDNLNHYEIVYPTTFFMFFNTQDEVFQNENIRKAFSIAINREELANVIFDGVHAPAYGWVPPSINMDEDEYREIADAPVETLISENSDPVDLLTQGLEELGMDPDPSNLTVKISLGGTDQWFRTYGEYLQQMYTTTLGINFEVEQMEWPVFNSNVEKGEFQIGYMSWGADFNDPSNMLNLFRSDAGAIGTGWVNERYDELIDLAGAEMDASQRLEYFKEAEEILLYEEAAVAPVVYPRTNLFRYDYIGGFGVNPFSNQGYKYGFTQGR